jgi:uncharacterized protein YegL
MAGANWQSLMNAVQAFLQKLEGDSNQKLNSRVTCIGYDTSAKIDFSELTPSVQLANRIPFTGGGTDFGPPLWLAL